ncbi:hypothetical protein [Xenorhabdus sp. TH1]
MHKNTSTFPGTESERLPTPGLPALMMTGFASHRSTYLPVIEIYL